MQHRSRLVLIVVLALMSLRFSPAGAQTNVFVDVPMRVHRGLPVIIVWINGSGPFSFGLDTGAMDSVVIDSSLALQLGLARRDATMERAAGARNHDKYGVSIDSMRIGNATFADISAVVVDYGPVQAPVDGTLGLRLFADFLTTIDYREKRLRIERAELPEVDGKTVLPLKGHLTRLPFLELDVEGHALSALVDTGNLAAPFYLPRSLVRQLGWASESSSTRRARTLGADIVLEEVTLAGVIRLGQYSFDRPVVVFGDTFSKAIIGGQALSEYIMTIDQKNSRLGLSQ